MRILRFFRTLFLSVPILVFSGLVSAAILYAADRTRSGFEEPRVAISPSAIGTLRSARPPFPAFVISRLEDKANSSVEPQCLPEFTDRLVKACQETEPSLDSGQLQDAISRSASATSTFQMTKDRADEIAKDIHADDITRTSLESLEGMYYYGEDEITSAVQYASEKPVDAYLARLAIRLRSYEIYQISPRFLADLSHRTISVPRAFVSALEQTEHPAGISQDNLEKMMESSPRRRDELYEYWPYIQSAFRQGPTEASFLQKVGNSVLGKDGELHTAYHAVTMVLTLILIASILGVTAPLWRAIAVSALPLLSIGHEGPDSQPPPAGEGTASEPAAPHPQAPRRNAPPETIFKLVEGSSGLVAVLGVAVVVTAGAVAYVAPERSTAEASEHMFQRATGRFAGDTYETEIAAKMTTNLDALVGELRKQGATNSSGTQHLIDAIAEAVGENGKALKALSDFQQDYDKSQAEEWGRHERTVSTLTKDYNNGLITQQEKAQDGINKLVKTSSDALTNTAKQFESDLKESNEQAEHTRLLSDLTALGGNWSMARELADANAGLLRDRQHSDGQSFLQRAKHFMLGENHSAQPPSKSFVPVPAWFEQPLVDDAVTKYLEDWCAKRVNSGPGYTGTFDFIEDLDRELNSWAGPLRGDDARYALGDGKLTKEALARSRTARMLLYEMVFMKAEASAHTRALRAD
jgi:hypothetical protein